MGNKGLARAKAARNDEFYTQREDIAAELQHYGDKFAGKTVYCNCDDPATSEFWRFFVCNFELLGLKKLMATYCKPRSAVRSGDTSSPPQIVSKTVFEGEEVLRTPLPTDGDFRSDECVELLEQADIVVTNPPFSLFREYVAQLMEHEKKFIIIGNMNAVTYKEIFPLIKGNRIWLGHTSPTVFRTAEALSEAGNNTFLADDGKLYAKFGNTRWFTNVDTACRHHDLYALLRDNRYDAGKYLVYDNYPAINVDKVADIPLDYQGVMGVPITFLDKYNPDQFEIVGSDRAPSLACTLGRKFTDDYYAWGKKGHFAPGHHGLALYREDGEPVVPFSRILIRNKHPEQPMEG